MIKTYQRRSPLANLGLVGNISNDPALKESIYMTEILHLAKINLRGDASKNAFCDNVKKILKIELPKTPNTIEGLGSRFQALWLGPDEWLLTSSKDSEHHLYSNLREQLKTYHVAITDVTESRTTIQLEGTNACQVIMKDCSLDLHPKAFKIGQCAQTIVAKTNIIMCRVLDSKSKHPIFQIHVTNSYAQHLWEWLEDAANEYRSAIVC